MRIEDDKRIFKKKTYFIVPFLMEERYGETEFEVYRGIKKTVQAFERDYKGRYFTRDALKYISSALDPYLEENGYERDTYGTTRFYYSYEMKDKAELDSSIVLPGTHRLTEEIVKTHKNPTTFDLKYILDVGLWAYVTLENGEVAAIATVNETLEEGSMPEVTVETAVNYRGKGYAGSCVAALCGALLDAGHKVAYCCRNTHSQSNRIAKRVGFRRIGRFYAVSAYRKTRE